MNLDSTRPRLILMEIDGVIARHSLRCAMPASHELVFLPHAPQALSLLGDAGYSVILLAPRLPANTAPSPSAFEASLRRFLLEIALSGAHVLRLYSWPHANPETTASLAEQSGLFYRARADFSLVPSETFFLGNSPSLLVAAAGAGYRTVRIRRGAFLESDAASEAANVASSLYDVALRLAAVSREAPRAPQRNFRFQADALRAPAPRSAPSQLAY